MIAERDRHQADTIGVRTRGLGQGEDAAGVEGAHRQVVVAGPAEAAQVGAPAHDLDQEARAELGVGREDLGVRRVEQVGRPDGRLLHWRGAAARRVAGHAAQGAIGGVVGRPCRGHVEAAVLPERLQQRLAARGLADALHQRRHQHLALTGGDHVGKQRERLGIDEGHGAAQHDQGVASRLSFGGVDRHARQSQQRQHVRVVPLERHRQREDVEVPDGRLRLDGQQLHPRCALVLQLLPRWQEHPLAHHVLHLVEETVDGLEAQVGHPDVVGVRERERHAKPLPVRLHDGTGFAGQRGPGPIAEILRFHEERPRARRRAMEASAARGHLSTIARQPGFVGRGQRGRLPDRVRQATNGLDAPSPTRLPAPDSRYPLPVTRYRLPGTTTGARGWSGTPARRAASGRRCPWPGARPGRTPGAAGRGHACG